MSKISGFMRGRAWLLGVLIVLFVSGLVYALMVEDGTGGGHKAKVDSENMLYTRSTQRPLFHHVTHEEKKAFSVTSGATTATVGSFKPTGAIGDMFFIRNDSTDDLNIHGIGISTNAGVTVYLVRGKDVGTVTQYESRTPQNLNFGSGAVAEGTVYVWDRAGNGMGGLTGGTTIFGAYLPAGRHSIELSDTPILTNTDNLTISMGASGGTGSASVLINVALFFHEEL